MHTNISCTETSIHIAVALLKLLSISYCSLHNDLVIVNNAEVRKIQFKKYAKLTTMIYINYIAESKSWTFHLPTPIWRTKSVRIHADSNYTTLYPKFPLQMERKNFLCYLLNRHNWIIWGGVTAHGHSCSCALHIGLLQRALHEATCEEYSEASTGEECDSVNSYWSQ